MYPILLHQNELSIGLIIEHAHEKCVHLSTNFIRNYLQQK